MPIDLRQISSGYDLSSINHNFQLIEQRFDEKLDRQTSSQGNEMRQDLDMNGYNLLNVGADSGLITEEEADERYVNADGDSMTGPLSVQPPTLSQHAAQYGQVVSALDLLAAETQARTKADKGEAQARIKADKDEASARSKADANLQAQITNAQPLEGSAFSPISWHKQVVDNSVTIPDDVNAWSFGPEMTVASGQVVEIGTNSFWTIADGEQQ